MSDWFQVVADLDVTEADAPRVAFETVTWLAERQIIRPELVTWVVGPPRGYPAGPRWADALANRDHARLGSDIVEVTAERTVFHGEGGGYDRVACPHCGTDVTWDDLTDLIGTWYDTGAAWRECPCGRATGLNELHWETPWAFGCFGLTFWNWPPLADRFVAGLADHTGHRIRLVSAKL